MKPRRFLVIAILLASLLAGSPSLMAAKKKPRVKKPTLGQEVFKRYLALKAMPDETLREENEVADKCYLHRFQNYGELEQAVESEYLIRVPDKGVGFYLDGSSFKDRGYGDRRYLAPPARQYLIERHALAYSKKFSTRFRHPRLEVTGLVRTQEYQEYLCKTRRNKNACSASGAVPEKRSVHTTGFTFDISTRGLSRDRVFWLAGFLDRDMSRGVILAIYEPIGRNFHVMVIPTTRGPA